MTKEKKDLVISSVLSRITDFQLQSSDNELVNWIEGLREVITNYSDNALISDICQKCGCSEFLCGHNKKT